MEINLTGTTTVDFILNEKNSFDITLTKKLNGVANNYPIGVWRCMVYDAVNKKRLITEFNDSNGFTVIGNIMELKRSFVENSLVGGIYYYEIKCTLPDNSTLLPFVGTLNIIKRST